MNKRGFFTELMLLIFTLLLGLLALFLVSALVALVIVPFTLPFLNSGSSVDVAYGLENNAFWGRFYLKDDHKTVYCIDKDDTQLIELAKQASREKLKVEVYYQEYIFRGSLCNFDDKYNSVVVTNMEIVE